MTEDFSSLTLTPIAQIRSCYPERFGIPRQSGLVNAATAEIVFGATEANKLSLRGIEQFSHLWIIFWFHQGFEQFKPLVQPPRLGGKKTMGVYATRSPNRPNPIGLSAVRLEQVEYKPKEILLHIRGGDVLDGTPVLDIKPYVPYADAIPTATSAWATAESPLRVHWSAEAAAYMEDRWAQGQIAAPQAICDLIEQTIAQDPRPAHERRRDGQVDQEWNLRVGGFDVFWKVEGGVAWVTRLVQLKP